MKKVVYLLCSAIILISISGCTQRNTTENNQIKTIDKQYGTNLGINNTPRSDLSVAPGATQIGTTQGQTIPYYKDGTYTGHSDMTAFGRQVATVTISGGRIIGVALSSTDKNNDNYYSVKDNSDVRKVLADSIIQSQTYNVTVSSNNPESVSNWKIAVKRALEQAQK